jgi:membrane protein YdbS with pleckstrin-like domain
MADNDKDVADGRSMDLSPPVALLMVIGAVVAILGLFVGGSVTLLIVGLVAVAVAGLLHVIGSR